jgi:hypothetical protein
MTAAKEKNLPQLLSGLLVLAALGVALVSLGGSPLPLVGAGRAALLAVAVLGISGCVSIGVSQAAQPGGIDTLGAVVQSALWVVVFAVIAAGLFGWDGLLRPLAGVAPGGGFLAATTAQLSIAALAALFALKYVVNLALALWAR